MLANLHIALRYSTNYNFVFILCAGKKKVKNMNIYMEPLIDELLTLYNTGVSAVDVSAPEGRQDFTLKAALL
jgi:hypothetical protein